jgi:hypothetical protein
MFQFALLFAYWPLASRSAGRSAPTSKSWIPIQRDGSAIQSAGSRIVEQAHRSFVSAFGFLD